MNFIYNGFLCSATVSPRIRATYWQPAEGGVEEVKLVCVTDRAQAAEALTDLAGWAGREFLLEDARHAIDFGQVRGSTLGYLEGAWHDELIEAAYRAEGVQS